MKKVKGILAYQQKDLDQMAVLIDQAKAMVQVTIVAEKIHDSGTCVLGAGICVEFLKPRCRNPERTVIIRQPFQGNLATLQALKPALAFLKSKGIECFYYDGVMD